MKNIILLTSILLLGTNAAYGQNESCYQSLVDEGMAFYNQQHFEEAIAALKAARGCWDKPSDDRLAELIDQVNDGYRRFLQEANERLAAARDELKITNEELAEQLDISKANSYAYLASLESERNNHEDALFLAYTAYQKVDTLPLVLRTFGDVVLNAKAVSLTEETAAIYLAVFDPENNYWITASNDSQVKVWDLQGRLLHTLAGHTAPVTQLLVHGEKNLIISSSNNGTIRSWTMEGTLLHTMDAHSSAVTQLAFSPDSTSFASADLDGGLYLWDLRGNQLAVLDGHDGKINSLTFSADGRHLLSASADNTIRLWDPSGKLIATMDGHQAAVWSADFLPDQNRLLSYSADQTTRLWDLTGVQTSQLSAPGMIRNAFPDRKADHYFTATADGQIIISNSSGQKLKEIKAHEDRLFNSSLNEQQQLVLSCGSDNRLRLWDETGNEVTSFDHGTEVYDGFFSPDGQAVISVTTGGGARLWDLNGNILLNWTPKAGKVNLVRFSPDSRYLFAGSDQGEAVIIPNPLKLIEYYGQHPLPPLPAEKRSRYGLE